MITSSGLLRLAVVIVILALIPIGATVPSSTSWVQYTTAAVPQTMTVPFVFQNASDLLVTDSRTSPPLILTLNSDYSVTGGAGSTGTVVTKSGGSNGVQAGDVITISRKVPLTQLTTFINGGPLNAQMIGQAVDKLTTISQQLNLIGANSLQFQSDEQISGVMPFTLRKNAFLAFDSNGRPIFPSVAAVVVTTAPVLSVNSITALRMVPIATVANNAPIFVTGYYTTNDGGGGTYIWNSSSTAADNGGSVIQPIGIATGRWILQFKEFLNVRQFGAKGDGSADDSAALVACDAAAAANAITVFVPKTSASYRCANVAMTCSWDSNGATLLFNGSSSIANAPLRTTGATKLTLSNLVLDGNVSADPPSWNSGNYNSFTGGRGAIFISGTNVVVKNCVFQNTQGSGLLFATCTQSLVTGCRQQRARGSFGDGYDFFQCIDVTVADCSSYDVTRIGFVCDTDSGSTGYRIQFTGCSAVFGHDASIIYGGAEYNSGFWAENSSLVTYTGCRVSNTTHRGFTCISGNQNNSVPGSHAMYAVSNCTVDKTIYGVVGGSAGSFPIEVVVVGLHATNVAHGVSFTANFTADSFTCANSYIDVDFNLLPLQTGPLYWFVNSGTNPVFRFLNILIAHTNEDITQYTNYNNTTYASDVAAFAGSLAATVYVDNVTNVTASKSTYLGIPTGSNGVYYVANMANIVVPSSSNGGYGRLTNFVPGLATASSEITGAFRVGTNVGLSGALGDPNYFGGRVYARGASGQTWIGDGQIDSTRGDGFYVANTAVAPIYFLGSKITFDNTNGSITSQGSVSLSSAGNTVFIKSGSNAMAGTVTLSGGSGTITSSQIGTNTVIFLTLLTSSGTPGTFSPRVNTGSGSATVTGAGTDNSTYNWIALKIQ